MGTSWEGGGKKGGVGTGEVLRSGRNRKQGKERGGEDLYGGFRRTVDALLIRSVIAEALLRSRVQ